MERASGVWFGPRVGHDAPTAVEGQRELVLLEREVEEARVLVREVERRAELVEREIKATSEAGLEAVRSPGTSSTFAARRSAVLGSVAGVGVAVVATGLIGVLTQWLR